MLNILLILLLQLLYVPIYTLRTIFLVKNITTLAAVLGIVEMLIYVFGLSLVFGGDQSFIAMFVYAVGFGIGIILGTKIETKLAIGYINVIVNTQNKNIELINMLRKNGFGVTIFTGEGRDSNRIRMEILTKRNRENELLATIEKFEPKAFIISYEPRQLKGGFLLARLKKHNRN
ncbi:DUF2179 domain-containing protein [Terrilactibacillus sp. BCM23-1]|uniref:UPF0316 protein GMB86_11315 n=1 Tax=Terrilactibacillus tamarindi TaxID=2599694 RepID=A0A6N8CU81_9BACI|nr:DUF2179 domain-containing protein [Terrilactibacillus tamarindi]MTT32595.1 DUF2179 domain-containing protein [Terrilactibacillus tamarindi]